MNSKYFICLANSFKRVDEKVHNEESGRCVAGVEITYPDCSVVMNIGYRRPNWIRPHADTPSGAIPVADAKSIALLDIIRIDDPVSIGKGAHSEDFSYSSFTCVGKYKGQIAPLVDSIHINYIFGSESPCMNDDYFQRFDHSLML